MIKVFVYGTLKKGGHLHQVISKGVLNHFIENKRIDGFSLYNAGAYPIAVPAEEKYIEGEVWAVDYETYTAIRWIELGAGYIETRTEDGIIFYIQEKSRLVDRWYLPEIGSKWEIGVDDKIFLD